MSRPARPCPLCAATSARPLLTGISGPAGAGSYDVVRCSSCGLTYTTPLPDAVQQAALYQVNYYVANKPWLLSGDFLRIVFDRSILWRRQSLLDRLTGRALDVGCGNGDFAAALTETGWYVYGSDPSAAACDLARSKGVDARQGNLEDAGYSDGFFDLVTMWHVLEHVPDPQALLAEVKRILASDGLLVVETPDAASVTARLCGAHWYPLDVPRHLTHFMPETLEDGLRRAGLRVRRCTSFHHWDFTFSFYSFMDWLGVRRLLHISGFSTSYKKATLPARILFLAISIPLAAFSLVYSLAATLLTGNGESVSVTRRKASPQ